MKGYKLELKTLTPDGGEPVVYRDLLLEMLRNAAPVDGMGRSAGFDFDELDKRIQLKKVIKEAGDAAYFTREQRDKLIECTKLMRWLNGISDEAWQFTTDIRAMPEVEMEESK